MNEVPTTPTALDRQEEVRVLNKQITELKSVKEIADRNAKEAIDRADDAKARADKLKEHITGLEGSISGLTEEMKKFLAECRKTLEEVSTMMEEMGRQAKALADRTDALVLEITNLEKQKTDLLADISRECEEMSRKRRDLKVYHGRILAAAEIHLPGQKVEI